MKIESYFDGACGPQNPGGTASWGFVIYQDKQEVFSASGVIGTGPTMTNNVAEIVALTELMKALIEKFAHADKIGINGDSNLVIRRMNGRGLKNPKGHYAPYIPAADGLALVLRARCTCVDFRWVPRERNERADELSKVGQRYREPRQTLDSEFSARLEREE